MRLYRTEKAFEQTIAERQAYDAFSVANKIVTADEIHELEPHLQRRYERGIWLNDTPSLTNPGQVCKQYAELFSSLGGAIEIQSANALQFENGRWKVHCENAQYEADDVVVAMGAWSPAMLKATGVKTCLAIERGYHALYEPQADTKLNRSIIDVDYGYVLTPMEMGIRVTSAADFVARFTDPTPLQLSALKPEIEGTFPLEKQLLDEPWMGHRPSTPDSLPVIGATPGRPGLWQAFGHGHLGLTLGPVTGELIADMMDGKQQNEQQAAFSPSRFS